MAVRIVDEGDEVHLEAELPESFESLRVGVVTAADLPRVRFVDADFEERDGSPVSVDVDVLGERKARTASYVAGPLGALTAGATTTKVWSTPS